MGGKDIYVLFIFEMNMNPSGLWSMDEEGLRLCRGSREGMARSGGNGGGGGATSFPSK